MTAPLETIRNLFALAEQEDVRGEPTDEARTAAYAAIKLIKKHGFVLTVAGPDGKAPNPGQPSPPRPVNPVWERKKRDLWGIVMDEGMTFLRSLDVLPKNIPVAGVQMVPAAAAGACGCGHRYRRGEMVSRGPAPKCARCVAAGL